MRMSRRLALIPPAAIAMLSAPAIAQGADEHAARVSDRILAALVEANGVPGMGAAVWRGDRIVWTGSAGRRDVERGLPVDENTIFRLASVSKVFAATAAAKLREEGRLDVDAPVRVIIPYLDNDWPAITSRQLAAHLSGLPHYQEVDAARGSHRFSSTREAVGIFAGRALLSAPGSAYAYSSWGYTLLSAAIEESAGRPYLDYLAEAVVPGLRIGPDATGSSDPDASRAYTVTGNTVSEAAPHDYSYSWAGAGLGATPRDLAVFGGRLMTGEVVSPATFAWMQVPARLIDGSPVRDEDYEIGFGWRIARDADGERIVHHAGVTTGARSTIVLYPDRNVAASLLSNALWVSSIEQSAMILSAPFRPNPLPAASLRSCPVETVRYQGVFGDQPIVGTARFAIEDGLCVGEITVANGLGEWLNRFPQKDAVTLRLIGMDADGGFSRAALVTPIGVYELRPAAGPGRYSSPLAGTRALSLNFEP